MSSIRPFLSGLVARPSGRVPLAGDGDAGKEVADSIEWSGTRLLCIAGDFTRYDLRRRTAEINRNVELIRYKFLAMIC